MSWAYFKVLKVQMSFFIETNLIPNYAQLMKIVYFKIFFAQMQLENTKVTGFSIDETFIRNPFVNASKEQKIMYFTLYLSNIMSAL